MLSPQSAPSVAIAASFTVEPLLPMLNLILREAGLNCGVSSAPYHQIFQELLTPTSQLAANRDGINAVVLRIEDYLREVRDEAAAHATIHQVAADLIDAFRKYAQRTGIPTIMVVLPPSPTIMDLLRSDIEKAAQALLDEIANLPTVHVLRVPDIQPYVCGPIHDELRDELAHIPFTDEFYAAMAIAIARKAHALITPPHKALILDCDNTLWRGVVGEDGIDGIEIDEPFLAIQRYAVEQQARGTLICLVSKNAEQDVLDVFDSRPEMILRMEHIVAHRINWQPKVANLSSLAQELNIGLDSFVFLDDNPVECGQVREALSQVVTLQVPADDDIPQFLANLWTFDKLAVTSEDVRRTSMYRENAARQKLEDTASDIGEFIASLQLAIDIAPPAENEWARVSQLTQRTNQFNFTTLRRTEAEVRAVANNGTHVLRVNVRDRFGDYGLVGLMIADSRGHGLLVDTLLLSCRVLGRGVEHAMLRRLGELARQYGNTHVELPYLATQKNEPARAFANSVAAQFRIDDQGTAVYRIPTDIARTIVHRPGHDPDAIVQARKAETNKPSGAVLSSGIIHRSTRYERLARELVSGQAILDRLQASHARTRTLAMPAQPPKSATQRRLVALWEELLNVDGIGIDDNYFALGGTSLLTARLFAEIARRFGVKLRLTAILDAPTVRSLARYIEPAGDRNIGSLVRLKDRGGRKRLFLVHDGDGETLLYLNLAKRLPLDVAVYGLEPRRIAGIPLAHSRVEDMASFYIEEIRKQQSHGPYFLGGMCAGGVIAYEMAAQLQRVGETVALVALLDAAAPQAKKRKGRITKLRVARLSSVLTSNTDHAQQAGAAQPILLTLGTKLLRALHWELSSRARHFSAAMRYCLLRMLLRRDADWPSLLPELTVRAIYDMSAARYYPKPMSGAGVMLLRASDGEGGDTAFREIYADEALGWDELVADLRIVDVDGGHSSMLQEQFVASVTQAILSRIDAWDTASNPGVPNGRMSMTNEALEIAPLTSPLSPTG